MNVQSCIFGLEWKGTDIWTNRTCDHTLYVSFWHRGVLIACKTGHFSCMSAVWPRRISWVRATWFKNDISAVQREAVSWNFILLFITCRMRMLSCVSQEFRREHPLGKGNSSSEIHFREESKLQKEMCFPLFTVFRLYPAFLSNVDPQTIYINLASILPFQQSLRSAKFCSSACTQL